jgi:hypothetical protein
MFIHRIAYLDYTNIEKLSHRSLYIYLTFIPTYVYKLYCICILTRFKNFILCAFQDGKISYEEFASMMRTGTDWRKASRHYSRGRFTSLSLKLMKDGSLQMQDSEEKKESA